MKKHHFIITLLIILSFSMIGQENLHQKQTNTQLYTKKIQTYISNGRNYLISSPDSSYKYFLKAVYLINKIKVAFFKEMIPNELLNLQRVYNGYLMLSGLYEKQGNKNQAYYYYKLYSDLKDSVNGLLIKHSVVQINKKYQIDKKRNENIILKKENELKSLEISRKNFTLVIIVILITVVLIFLITISILLKIKSMACKNMDLQNKKILSIEAEYNRKFQNDNLMQNTIHLNSDSTFNELAIRFEKLMNEDKPYLWSDVTLDEFCKILKTNRTYLSKMINEKYKMTFFELICEYRIKEAEQMLKDPSCTYMSVESIGTLSGFKSNSNFHRNFKKHFSTTPNNYREKFLSAGNI